MTEQPGSADLLSFWWGCIEAGYQLDHDDQLMPDDQPVLHYCANGASAMVFARDMRAAVTLIDQHHDAAKTVESQRAIIDRLMLEFCPAEMTPEQIRRWKDNQRGHDSAPTADSLPLMKRSRTSRTKVPIVMTGSPEAKLMMPIDSMQLDDLYPIEQLAQTFPAQLTVAALRWQLRHRNDNGLAHACVRIGKRLLISRVRYEAWLAGRADAPEQQR